MTSSNSHSILRGTFFITTWFTYTSQISDFAKFFFIFSWFFIVNNMDNSQEQDKHLNAHARKIVHATVRDAKNCWEEDEAQKRSHFNWYFSYNEGARELVGSVGYTNLYFHKHIRSTCFPAAVVWANCLKSVFLLCLWRLIWYSFNFSCLLSDQSVSENPKLLL